MESQDIYLKLEDFDTYIELVFSIMTVRHPSLHPYIMQHVPGIQLRSSYVVDGEKQDLCIPAVGIINGFKDEGLKDVKSLKNGFVHLNCMFLLSSWDKLTSTSRFEEIKNESDVQFFRHIRNACAHGNSFNFKSLSRPAKWRDKELIETDKGKSAFPDKLKEGDVFLLILDINNKYFLKVDIQGIKEWKG